MTEQTQNQIQISEARKAKYPVMMELMQNLRTNKELSDAKLHPVLDKALSEVTYYGDEAEVMLKRVLFHIGDVSRQHNILKEAGIVSSKGGAGERANFRSVMRWWEKKLKDDFYRKLNFFAEYTVIENLLYDQIRTDRTKGTVKREEKMEFDLPRIVEFFATIIRKSRNPLIAKHLPKYPSGKYRYSVSKKGVKYKRAKQDITLKREARQRKFVSLLCKELGWNLKDYRDYRKKQHTPEQLFSSKEILNLSEDVVMKMFDAMTSSQRFRVAHMLAEKDTLGHLRAKEKWGNLGTLYIRWENAQTKIVEEIRNTEDPTKREKVVKELKVKATGMQTIDLLAKMVEGRLTDDQVNNTYQALLEKMDLVGNVFPVIDGSSSMNRQISEGWSYGGYKNYPFDSRYGHIRLYDVAAAMAIAFATRNPNPDYKNSFGWFSNDFVVVGQSKYADLSPNPFVKDAKFIVAHDTSEIISDKYPFTKNFMRAKQANPGIVSNTNIGATIQYFIDLHKRTGMRIEELPGALLFITDNEGNNGMSPKEFMAYANNHGWSPLVIFWGLKQNKMTQYGDIPNCLFIGGFSESVLGQILRGIKTGSIQPETELWSINDDPRYKLIV